MGFSSTYVQIGEGGVCPLKRGVGANAGASPQITPRLPQKTMFIYCSFIQANNPSYSSHSPNHFPLPNNSHRKTTYHIPPYTPGNFLKMSVLFFITLDALKKSAIVFLYRMVIFHGKIGCPYWSYYDFI